MVKEAIDRILKAEKQADEIENDAVQTVKQIESETTQTVAAIFDQAKKQTENGNGNADAEATGANAVKTTSADDAKAPSDMPNVPASEE